jgi:hypothetical protein
VRILANQNKRIPALAQSVLLHLCEILSCSAKIETENGRLVLIYAHKIIARIDQVSLTIQEKIKFGASKLRSKYSCELFLLFISKASENWALEKPEIGRLFFDGGKTEIMRLIGIRSRKAIPIIDSLLLALAHMRFAVDDKRKENLIKMRASKSNSSLREDAIEIELDESLLPKYGCRKKQGKRLLVPTPASRIYVAPSKYQACEFVLMLLLLNEFCVQSMSLASKGCIRLTAIELDNIFRRAGFPSNVGNHIRQKWMNDMNSAFLICVAPDEYSLGSRYALEKQFLIAQGQLRLRGQHWGKKAAQRAAKKRERLLNTPTTRSR